MASEVVIIFDIGKTNKKILLFDRKLHILHEEEIVFEEIPDDDGFQGDDIESLEEWILQGCQRFLSDPDYVVRGINFTTYGATLMYLDQEGKRLTPVYNYLKPMPEGIVEPVYERFGGEEEFCRKTASPALGMLNAGFQALWLKENKPELFGKVKTILHFPQYLSYLLTGKVASEHTSIGCHTALWDFDLMQYHPWTALLEISLPHPIPVEITYPSGMFDPPVPVGIGIHDSSSSLVPYFMHSPEPFILVSTGTWCISMNPFNKEPLTTEQLRKDCLSYMSVQQNPVKSSRLFMGKIHDVNVEGLSQHFGVDSGLYKQISLDASLLKSLQERNRGRVFFRNGIPVELLDETPDLSAFGDFGEAYHQLMVDLTDLTVEAIRLIIPENDTAQKIYISGGFSKNPIFLHLIEVAFPDKRIITSEVANGTSLGAALVLWKGIDPEFRPEVSL
ncbi:MAG: FGGY-family carbohydrate kinase [Bacteroidales bacterium]